MRKQIIRLVLVLDAALGRGSGAVGAALFHHPNNSPILAAPDELLPNICHLPQPIPAVLLFSIGKWVRSGVEL
jgi:hypothetical protein